MPEILPPIKEQTALQKEQQIKEIQDRLVQRRKDEKKKSMQYAQEVWKARQILEKAGLTVSA